MKTDSKLLRILTFSYIYLPILIFLAGYTKSWVFFITSGICIFYGIKMINAFDNKDEMAHIHVDIRVFITVLLIICLYCIYIGYGGIFEQAGDWSKHNAVLHDLSERSWPVYYTNYDDAMLTYYLGQYMVAALIGKIVGIIAGVSVSFEASSALMAIWAFLGVVLVYLNLVRITKSNTAAKQLRTLLIMLFFSGALPLAQLIAKGIYGDDMYSLGHNHWLLYNGLMMQYRSNMVMLRWVYPQVIVIWLIIILFLENKDKTEFYVLLFAPILLFGTFSIIIPAACAIIYCFYKYIRSNEKIKELKSVFSLCNILVFFSLGIVLVSYFVGYMQVEKPAFLNIHIQVDSIFDIWGILVFDVCMFGIYAWGIYKDQKRNILFYICVTLLAVIPIFKMGLYNDFVMCASIPGLFCILIWVLQTLNKDDNTKEYGVRVGVILFCLIIGVWYQMIELRDNIDMFMKNEGTGIEDYYTSLEQYADRDSNEQKDLIYNYFTYDLDGKLFYEVFARKKIEE